MTFFSRLFGNRRKCASGPSADQAVIVRFPVSGLDVVALAPLEDRLRQTVERGGLGEFDGDEIGADDATLYLYGRDAERLFEAIRPILTASPLCRDARVEIRLGAPGSTQREVRLGRQV